jgi:hypothetical protein
LSACNDETGSDKKRHHPIHSFPPVHESLSIRTASIRSVALSVRPQLSGRASLVA